MNKPNTVLSGAGFYIVLLLCLLIVGVSGYLVLFGESSQPAMSPAEEDLYADLDPEGPSLEILEPERVEPVKPAVPVSAPVAQAAAQESKPVAVKKPSLIVWPLRGAVVAAFSVDTLVYDQTMGDWRTHAGTDLAADLGTQVMAACAGTVSSVEEDPLMGTTVVLDHGGGLLTTYANLQSTPAVSPGDSVTAGQILGAVGDTAIAEAAEVPHLHFSVEKNGKAVDPLTFLKQ